MKQNSRLLMNIFLVGAGVAALLAGAYYVVQSPGESAAGAATPEVEKFQAGLDYEEVDEPLPARADGRLEAELFFWYGCPACYVTDPPFNNWAEGLSDDVVFVRTPAVFSGAHEMHARIHYSIEALELPDKERVSNKVYREIHENQNHLVSEQQIIGFLIRSGADRKRSEDLFNSFAMATTIREAQTRAMQLKINSTPTLTVGGRYRIASGSPDRVTAIADYLLDKLRAEQLQEEQMGDEQGEEQTDETY